MFRPISVAALLILAACGTSTTTTGTSGASTTGTGLICAPGASVACVGVGGCQGGQVCAADGKSYGTCQCSSATTSGSGGGTSGATTGGTGSGGSTTGSPPTTTALAGTVVPGGGPGHYELDLTVASGGLPDHPSPSGVVTVTGQLSTGSVTVPMTGTYDTGLKTLNVSDPASSFPLSGAASGEVIQGSFGAGSGKFAMLFVPAGGSALTFCGNASGIALNLSISSDGTVVGTCVGGTDLGCLGSGTEVDGGVSVTYNSGSTDTLKLVSSDGGVVLIGADYSSDCQPGLCTGDPSGC